MKALVVTAPPPPVPVERTQEPKVDSVVFHKLTTDCPGLAGRGVWTTLRLVSLVDWFHEISH